MSILSGVPKLVCIDKDRPSEHQLLPNAAWYHHQPKLPSVPKMDPCCYINAALLPASKQMGPSCRAYPN